MSVNGIEINSVNGRQAFSPLEGIEDVEQTEAVLEEGAVNGAVIFSGENKIKNVKISEDDILEGEEEVNEADKLLEELQTIKEDQGLIGKAWDGIKNLFNMKNGSENVESLIERAKNGEISLDEARERLEGYKEGQKMCVDVAGDIVSGIAAVGAAALAPVTGGASLLVAAGVGAGTKIAIKATDAAVGGREYGIRDVGYDVITGSINGLMAPLSNAIGGAAGTGVAKAFGLQSVETCAKAAVKEAGEEGIKQVGKSFLARLLAKQTIGYVAGEGVEAGAKVVAGKVLAYGVDMAIDGALSGAADGLARAVAEGRTEDIPSDMLKGAAFGAAGGVVIGGSTKLIFKGASKLSAKMASSAGDEIADAASKSGDDIANAVVNNADETAKLLAAKKTAEGFMDKVPQKFASIDDALSYLSASDNIRAKDIESAINKALKEGRMDSGLILKRVNLAVDLMEGGESYAVVKELSENLYNYLDSSTYTRDAVSELQEALGFNGDIVFNSEKGIYVSKNPEGTMTARAKSSDSILSKIRNKVFDLKTDMPESAIDAQHLIGDAQGTRLVINSAADSLDFVRTEAAKTLKGSEVDSFMEFVRTGKLKGASDETLSRFKSLQSDILNDINRKQTAQFCDNLADAMIEGRARVTELHNYSDKNGLPYIAHEQVERLQDAYDQWFKRAQAGDFGEYITVGEGAEMKIIDADGNCFLSRLIVESPDVADAAAAKKAIKPNGYTAAQFNIVTKAGQNEEFQLRGEFMDSLAECEHMVYDLKKGKETVLGTEYDGIRGIISKIQADSTLKNEYNNYFGRVFEASRKAELGIPNPSSPTISSYGGLSKTFSSDELDAVSIDGLIRLHDYIQALKKGA